MPNTQRIRGEGVTEGDRGCVCVCVRGGESEEEGRERGGGEKGEGGRKRRMREMRRYNKTE